MYMCVCVCKNAGRSSRKCLYIHHRRIFTYVVRVMIRVTITNYDAHVILHEIS